jgi:HPt (histidine-containing phosphotransfer) domain-containing protein
MTAHAMDEDREICFAAGMDDYITKPFQPLKLVSMLHAYTPAPAMHDSSAGRHQQKPANRRRELVEGIAKTLETQTGLKTAQVEKLLDKAVLSISQNLHAANTALEQKDYQTLHRTAHNLKGVLLQCGLTHGADLAGQIQRGSQMELPLPYLDLLKEMEEDLRVLLEL